MQKRIFEPYQCNASPWQKGAHLACHITTPMIDEKHTQTKICANINMQTDIAISSCRYVEKQCRNV